jgi:phage shock protein PspC (stress-responsive transcriptional regulator)
MEPETQVCPICAMSISSRALRCPHCRARQPSAPQINRGSSKLVAGVCGMIAEELSLDPTLVRVLFVCLVTVSGGLVLGAYILLWLVTPPVANGLSPVSRFSRWIDGLFSSSSTPPQQPASPS